MSDDNQYSTGDVKTLSADQLKDIIRRNDWSIKLNISRQRMREEIVNFSRLEFQKRGFDKLKKLA